VPPPAPPIHRSQDESISASVCAKEKNNKSNVSAKEKNNVLKKENIECVKEKIESMKESDSMQKVRATTPQGPPDGPLPPCPASSPSLGAQEGQENSLASSDSSTGNLSSIPKTEVEVFEFREVESRAKVETEDAGAQTVGRVSPPVAEMHQAVHQQEAAASPTIQPMDLMDEVDEELAELAELDNLSNKSSACDCPAHVHDREFPLEIAKGHEAAFDHVDMLCPPDEYSNPPSLSLAPQTPSHLAPSPPNSPPTGTPTLSTASTSRRAPRAMPNYSYGCLMKKWSL